MIGFIEPWTDINILRFLRLYQSYPVLWDATNCGYKNRRIRISAYRQIIKNLKLRNANVDSCMRLVEWLKRCYIEEKKSIRELRPTWYTIISRIIDKVLDPKRKKNEVSCTSFEACIDCCAPQDQTAPCCYFRASVNGSDVCSQAQSSRGEKAPCCCNVGQDDDMNIVVLSLKPCLENVDNFTDSSEQECETESDVKGGKSKSEIGNCSDVSLCSSIKSCTENSKEIYLPSGVDSIASSGRSNDAVGEFEMQPTTTSRSGSEKTGLFTDSSRARFRDGKPISLTDEYYANDDLLLTVGERTQVIEPRLHYASCHRLRAKRDERHEFYPLQLDM